MVARSPAAKQRKMVAPLDPVLLRQTLEKVDKCMERLKELQYTVTGGNKVVSGVTLSPRSTRGYLRTSLRCKQESLTIKNANSRRSPNGKLPTSIGDWRRMSLPAMLLGETVGEILQASQFAKEIAEVVAPKKTNIMKKQQDPSDNDPKTPLPKRRIAAQRRPSPENSGLQVRRKREKQMANHATTPSVITNRFQSPNAPRRNGEILKEKVVMGVIGIVWRLTGFRQGIGHGRKRQYCFPTHCFIHLQHRNNKSFAEQSLL